MTSVLRLSLCVGYECVAAWADVLDRINLFPVPDGDTGRNLVLSLVPLRDTTSSDQELERKLLLSARGNSGNIAVEFVRHLLEYRKVPLADCFVRSAASARKAVADPQPGTMLTVLDTLAASSGPDMAAADVKGIIEALAAAVRSTAQGLQVLRDANVVDSGALGMLVFLDGFLHRFFDLTSEHSFTEEFRALAHFERARNGHQLEHANCIDAVVRLHPGTSVDDEDLHAFGHDVISLNEGDLWKVHLHTSEPDRTRARIEQLGQVVRWSWDCLQDQIEAVSQASDPDAVHVMTDGAASISRRDAESHGITLLDNYVALGDISLPETRLAPGDSYAAMRRGVSASTSQASVFERHRRYARIVEHYQKALYLCVGSAYTGNYAVARSWTEHHPQGERLAVLDSGAASGRLAVVVWATARRARQERALDALASYARQALHRAEEYIFLDKLEYLARGGRVSKTSALFADALSVAPVVSPMPDGVRKIKVLRRPEAKVEFACERLAAALAPSQGHGLVLLEHTDNQDWIEGHLLPLVRKRLPLAECHVRPLSITTGIHTGPGTWAVAVLPAEPGAPT